MLGSPNSKPLDRPDLSGAFTDSGLWIPNATATTPIGSAEILPPIVIIPPETGAAIGTAMADRMREATERPETSTRPNPDRISGDRLSAINNSLNLQPADRRPRNNWLPPTLERPTPENVSPIDISILGLRRLLTRRAISKVDEAAKKSKDTALVLQETAHAVQRGRLPHEDLIPTGRAQNWLAKKQGSRASRRRTKVMTTEGRRNTLQNDFGSTDAVGRPFIENDRPIHYIEIATNYYGSPKRDAKGNLVTKQVRRRAEWDQVPDGRGGWKLEIVNKDNDRVVEGVDEQGNRRERVINPRRQTGMVKDPSGKLIPRDAILLGTPAHRERMAAQRMPSWLRRSMRRADDKAERLNPLKSRAYANLTRSANGEDLHGRILNRDVREKAKYSSQLRRHNAHLEQLERQKQARWENRQRNRRQRKQDRRVNRQYDRQQRPYDYQNGFFR